MPEKHLSTQFDSELSAVSTRVMELGGLVESQIRNAIYALSQFSAEVANQVTEAEARVNAMEVEIDRDLSLVATAATLPTVEPLDVWRKVAMVMDVTASHKGAAAALMLMHPQHQP